MKWEILLLAYATYSTFMKQLGLYHKKVKVGNDQETMQSKRNSKSKNRGGKKLNWQLVTYTKKTYCKPDKQLFPNRQPKWKK